MIDSFELQFYSPVVYFLKTECVAVATVSRNTLRWERLLIYHLAHFIIATLTAV